MNWFLYAFAGASFLAATAVMNKFLLCSCVKHSTCYLISLILVQQIFTFGVFLSKGAEFIYPESVLAMASGFVQVVLWVAYLKALNVDDVSRVSSLAFLYPILVFLGGAVFLGEALTFRHYAGGALLMASAVLASYKPARGRPLLISPAIKYLLVFWSFSAVYAMASKYLLSFMDEWHLIIWSSIGNLLAVAPFLLDGSFRSESLRIFKNGFSVTAIVLAEEAFDFLGRASFIFAYASGPVALVSSASALQPLIVLIYIAVLSLIWPGAISEEISRGTLAIKLMAVALVAIGIWLIS